MVIRDQRELLFIFLKVSTRPCTLNALKRLADLQRMAPAGEKHVLDQRKMFRAQDYA